MRAWVITVGVAAACAGLWFGLGRLRGVPASSSTSASGDPGMEIGRAEPAPAVVAEQLLRGMRRRVPTGDGAVPGPLAPAIPPQARWDLRLRTNGVVDMERATRDEEYSRQVRRHQRIKSLLLSPARDTPECAAILALTERLGITVAAVPDLYHAVWDLRVAEDRARQAGQPAARESIEFVAGLAWEDMQLRFTRDLGIPAEPVFQELKALDLHPSVFFGVPAPLEIGAKEGLLVED